MNTQLEGGWRLPQAITAEGSGALVRIDLREMQRHEAGSALLSYLCYPRVGTDDAARDQQYVALCHSILRYRAKHDAIWTLERQAIWPAHAFVDPDAFQKAVRQTQRRLRDRAIAGRMAIGLLTQAMAGRQPVLPKGMTRLSLAQLAGYFLDQSGETEPENLIKRAWSQSKPVIHLAAAFEIYQRMAQDRGHPGMMADVQHLPGALEEVIEIAREHEEPVVSNPAFNVKSDGLIRFELVR